MLKSNEMSLSPQERRWLPWLGKTGKLAMRWACFLNKRRYPVLEQTFEGIAGTRVKMLRGWAKQQWATLSHFSEEVLADFPPKGPSLLQKKKPAFFDCSELFVIDIAGTVLASTYPMRAGKRDLLPEAVRHGLQGQFLHPA